MILKILKLNIKNKNKFNIFCFTTLVLVLGFFIFQENSLAKDNEKKDIIITEIMYNPESGKSDWIEIFTKKEIVINNKWGVMDEFNIKKDGKKNTCHTIKNNNNIIKKGEYIIFVDDINKFKKNHLKYSGKIFDTILKLKSSDQDTVRISKDRCVSFINEIKYNPKKDEKVKKGYSLELDNNKWRQSYMLGGTPGEQKSKKPEPKKYSNKIRINEILPNPKGDDKAGEFIELYNYGNKEIDLKNWILKDSSKTGKYVFPENKKDIIIKSNNFIKIYRKDFKFALNNKGDEIKIKNPNNKIVDKISYKKAQEGFSYNFNEDNKKWEWSSFLTPGKKNKFDKKKTYTNKIRINEILPNPKGKEKEYEFIELYNYGNKNINLEGWILKDSSKTGKYIFPENKNIKSNKFLIIYRKDFKFALNNSGEEVVYLQNPNNNEVYSVKYNNAKENISYNFNSNNKWRWSRFLTPGKKNKFDKLPEIKIDIDNDVYKNIYADFKVNIKGVNKNDLKVRWDFGDKKKSYKKETRHKYKKEGKYSVVTKVFNGSEEFKIINTIKVEKFPRYNIEIISFIPNPEGRDVDGEWIELKNNSKKRINLKNWSIATGKNKKSLVNHPVNEKIKIKSGKIEKITRNESYFSLNNKKGYIELRYPDGKVVDKVSYENKDGIKDNDIYQKDENGEWRWIIFENKIINEDSQNQKPEVKGEMIVNEAILKNIGKRSWVEIDKNYIFNKYNLKKEIISLIWKNDKKVRLENGTYYFNPVVKKKKYYIVRFFENIV